MQRIKKNQPKGSTETDFIKEYEKYKLEIKTLQNTIKELQDKKKREADYHEEYLEEKKILVQEIQSQKNALNLEISDMRKDIVSISNQIKSIELFISKHDKTQKQYKNMFLDYVASLSSNVAHGIPFNLKKRTATNKSHRI